MKFHHFSSFSHKTQFLCFPVLMCGSPEQNANAKLELVQYAVSAISVTKQLCCFQTFIAGVHRLPFSYLRVMLVDRKKDILRSGVVKQICKHAMVSLQNVVFCSFQSKNGRVRNLSKQRRHALGVPRVGWIFSCVYVWRPCLYCTSCAMPRCGPAKRSFTTCLFSIDFFNWAICCKKQDGGQSCAQNSPS